MPDGYNSNYRLTYYVRYQSGYAYNARDHHNYLIRFHIFSPTSNYVNNTSLENHICITNGIVIMT